MGSLSAHVSLLGDRKENQDRVSTVVSDGATLLIVVGSQTRLEAREAAPLAPSDAQVETALTRAGDNRAELSKALQEIEPEYREGLRFLIAYMPSRDLKALSGEYPIVEPPEMP